jgi:hypothetical protein
MTDCISSLYTLLNTGKRRHLGFGVFVDIWSMLSGMENKLLGRKATLRQRRSCSEEEQSFEDEQVYRNSEEYIRVQSTEEKWE